ncbi:MAG: hypothetical protein ACLTK0_02870 [Anaerovoracaceae bacterium]
MLKYVILNLLFYPHKLGALRMHLSRGTCPQVLLQDGTLFHPDIYVSAMVAASHETYMIFPDTAETASAGRFQPDLGGSKYDVRIFGARLMPVAD